MIEGFVDRVSSIPLSENIAALKFNSQSGKMDLQQRVFLPPAMDMHGHRNLNI
jgi:hypothetical protein